MAARNQPILFLFAYFLVANFIFVVIECLGSAKLAIPQPRKDYYDNNGTITGSSADSNSSFAWSKIGSSVESGTDSFLGARLSSQSKDEEQDEENDHLSEFFFSCKSSNESNKDEGQGTKCTCGLEMGNNDADGIPEEMIVANKRYYNVFPLDKEDKDEMMQNGSYLVFHGKSVENGECVAIKKHCYEEEMKVLRSCQNDKCPNVIKLVDYDSERKQCVLEIGSITLEALWKRGSIAKYGKKCAEIKAEVAAGVDQLHKLGYAHNDLHPGNAMLFKQRDGKYVAKLMDSGNAKKISKWRKNGELKKEKQMVGLFIMRGCRDGLTNSRRRN